LSSNVPGGAPPGIAVLASAMQTTMKRGDIKRKSNNFMANYLGYWRTEICYVN